MSCNLTSHAVSSTANSKSWAIEASKQLHKYKRGRVAAQANTNVNKQVPQEYMSKGIGQSSRKHLELIWKFCTQYQPEILLLPCSEQLRMMQMSMGAL